MIDTEAIKELRVTLKHDWRTLAVTDLGFKILSFAVLTPILSVLIQILLRVSGHEILSDVDIALFLTGPFGWLSVILVGAVWLGIFALEQSALLSILATRTNGAKPSLLSAVRFALVHSVSVLRVTGRIAGWSLVVLAPFVILAAVVYRRLLTEYDINYYLQERPQEFTFAVSTGAVIVALLSLILIRFYSGWFLSLPLVLFDKTNPRRALPTSSRKIAGRRYQVLIWIVLWGAAGFAINLLATVVVAGIGDVLIPSSVSSITWLAARVGLMLALLSTVSLLLNAIGTISFSFVLYYAYRSMHPASLSAMQRTIESDSRQGKSLPTLTRTRLAAACLTGAACSMLLGVLTIRSLQTDDVTQVMAHRGASKVAPENSLAAIRSAIEMKADWVEIDVQETVDGEVVVVHDSDFMKLSRNSLKIWDARYEDLAEIDIGSWLDPKFADERVPKLADVLELCKGHIGVIIELKYYGHDQQLEQRVADIVESFAMQDEVMVMSLKLEGVKKFRALRPKWKCGVLMSVAVGNVNRIDADFFAINARFATRSFIKRAHKAGKEVFVWTVNDPVTMSTMMNRGVNGLLTDYPDMARQVLIEREEMSSSERLVTEAAIFLGVEPKISEQ